MHKVLPFCNILIGNETEAETWAVENRLDETKDLAKIAKALAIIPRTNPSRPRIVVITHGAESTILVSSAQPDVTKEYPVEKLDDSQIVDTNGAGDAFAGGFIGAYVSGKDLDDCVRAGHALASICVQQVGRTATHEYRTKSDMILGRPSVQVAQSQDPIELQLHCCPPIVTTRPAE